VVQASDKIDVGPAQGISGGVPVDTPINQTVKARLEQTVNDVNDTNGTMYLTLCHSVREELGENFPLSIKTGVKSADAMTCKQKIYELGNEVVVNEELLISNIRWLSKAKTSLLWAGKSKVIRAPKLESTRTAAMKFKLGLQTTKGRR
jgi:hypothetical protein